VYALHAAGDGARGVRPPTRFPRVTWQYEFPPSLLRLFIELLCCRGGLACGVGAGASAAILTFFFIIEADQKNRVTLAHAVGFRNGERRRIPQPGARIHLQDSPGMGVADGGNECSRW